MFWVTLLTFFVVWCLQFHWKRKRLYEASWKVPGPLTLPFIGSWYLFLKTDASAISKRFLRLFDEYPDLSKLWAGPDLIYLVTKPEFLQIILNSPRSLGKPHFYDVTKPFVGNGLAVAPVETWKMHKKIIFPSLSQKILNSYVEKISQNCGILVDILQRECGKGEIDCSKYVTYCIMRIIVESLFGVPASAHIDTEEMSGLIDKGMEIVFQKCFVPAYQSDFIFSFTKDYRDLQKSLSKLKEINRAIIDGKKEQLASKIETEEEENSHLLDLLMQKHFNQEFSLDEVMNEVNTFLIAGSDTTATSTSFVLTLLGMHPEIQQQVYEEVLEVLGPDRAVTLDDLPKLKYTERVVKEALRLFPSVPYVGRVVEEDISLGPFVIPRGATAILGFLSVQRNAKYWKDPLKFDPDRFLPENSVNRHSYTWLPFSGGSRNCIGLKFGMMMEKSVIALVIQKYRVKSTIKSVSDIEIMGNMLLRPTEGFRVAFEVRQSV